MEFNSGFKRLIEGMPATVSTDTRVFPFVV